MRRANSLKNGCLQGRGFIKLLMLQDSQRFPDHFPFIHIAARFDQSFDKLAERWRKGDRHMEKI